MRHIGRFSSKPLPMASQLCYPAGWTPQDTAREAILHHDAQPEGLSDATLATILHFHDVNERDKFPPHIFSFLSDITSPTCEMG